MPLALRQSRSTSAINNLAVTLQQADSNQLVQVSLSLRGLGFLYSPLAEVPLSFPMALDSNRRPASVLYPLAVALQTGLNRLEQGSPILVELDSLAFSPSGTGAGLPQGTSPESAA